MRPTETVRCPSCATPLFLDLEEPEGPEFEELREDCETCGRPLIITGSLDATGRPVVQIRVGEPER